MAKVLTSKDVRRWFRFSGSRAAAAVLLLVLCAVLSSCAGSGGAGRGSAVKDFKAEAKEAITGLDPAMGDWQGGWKLNDGSDSGPLVAQVIALGNGEYKANFLEVFDTRMEPIGILVGRLEGGAVQLAGRAYHSGIDFNVNAKIEGGKLTGDFTGQDVKGTFALEQVFRVSETMGAKPTKGAVVLFNGKNFKEWRRADAKDGEDDAVRCELVDGAMRIKGGSIITKKTFTDAAVHIEFRSPFMPEARGQGRGNSGVYVQGRYEIQVLDSYGLKGESNECGGIYGAGAPRVNMCAPPGQWQTYDIFFDAARYDSAGNKTSDATITVRHNGVTIHDQVKMGGATPGGLGGNESEPGGIFLQDHGNAVEYRNIWLVEQ
ncbi:MAG: DUF1080 domain-containing protein [Sedimentisphaerales bacterium]|nr:DUF1080 domain-containing protein [Sedimentisphaerales bacterium]